MNRQPVGETAERFGRARLNRVGEMVKLRGKLVAPDIKRNRTEQIGNRECIPTLIQLERLVRLIHKEPEPVLVRQDLTAGSEYFDFILDFPKI